MKAHINGITLEGTPQEIMEYQRLQGEQATKFKPVQPAPHWDGPWWGIFPPNGTAKP